MLARMRPGGVGARLVAVRELWQNPALRRAELAWGGFHAAEWASLVALSVVAFESNGAGAVGLVLFARMVPSALVAPFVAVVGDRYRRERILIVVHLVRALACLGAAVALAVDANIARRLRPRRARRRAARRAPPEPSGADAVARANRHGSLPPRTSPR